jgi:hypothetical protein
MCAAAVSDLDVLVMHGDLFAKTGAGAFFIE